MKKERLFQPQFVIQMFLQLVGTAVVIALSWGSLNTKVDLANQKLDFVAQKVEEHAANSKDEKAEENKANQDRDKRIAENEKAIDSIKTQLSFLKKL